MTYSVESLLWHTVAVVISIASCLASELVSLTVTVLYCCRCCHISRMRWWCCLKKVHLFVTSKQ